MGKKSDSGKLFVLGTLMAAVAGYVTGILTAPKSGKETRKDIANTAGKARVEGERQLKRLHSELNELIKEADKRTQGARDKASKEFQDAVEKAKVAKEKSREILSALHNGDTDDPDLQSAVAEIKAAKQNLSSYLKK